MKLDVAWVGRGYQFALNANRDAYEGIEKNSDAHGFVWTTCVWAGTQIAIRVGAAKGRYKDMPANRSYIADVHVPSKPSLVRLEQRALPGFEKRAEYDAAAEGWFFDARDRRGILHVKTKSQPLTAAFTVRVTM